MVVSIAIVLFGCLATIMGQAGPLCRNGVVYDSSILERCSQRNISGSITGEVLVATTIVIIHAGSHDNDHIQARDDAKQLTAPAVPDSQIKRPTVDRRAIQPPEIAV